MIAFVVCRFFGGFIFFVDCEAHPACLEVCLAAKEHLTVENAGDDVKVGGIAGEDVPPAVQLRQRPNQAELWRQKINSEICQILAKDVVNVPEKESEQIPEIQRDQMDRLVFQYSACYYD